MIINPAKCQFGLLLIDFLRHWISAQGAIPLTSKVQVVVDFPCPSSMKGLEEFLGMVKRLMLPTNH